MNRLTQPWVTVVRWLAVAAGLVLAGSGDLDVRVGLGAAVLGAHAGWRTLRPTSSRSTPSLLADFAVCLATAAFTGGLGSPYLVSLGVPLLMAGYRLGLPGVFGLTTATLGVLNLPLVRHGAPDYSVMALWAQELLLLGAAGTFAGRVVAASRANPEGVSPRTAVLRELNGLLIKLYRATEVQPVSLALTETVRTTVGQLRDGFHPDVLLILLRDAVSTWSVAFAEGSALPDFTDRALLPPQLALTACADGPRSVHDLARHGGGVALAAGSGLYAPLHVRDELIGVVLAESSEVGRFGPREVAIMRAHAADLALAVDNSRWFGRLRLLGAEQERGRMARDLHDRVAQPLVYLGIEAENLAFALPPAAAGGAATLAVRIRETAAEVRETISDLRADVTDSTDLVTTIDRFAERMRRRSATDVVFWHYARRRLPLAAEREVWRIAQEAMANAERHASASRISVLWLCDEDGAVLEVADDGTGLAVPTPGRYDAYGLVGIRERADALGGSVEIDSRPGAGTTVRLRIGSPV